MKNFIFSALALLITGCLFSSCYGDCYCTKDLGCTVLTVKKTRNPAGTALLTKTFCSQIDYHADWALQDSVRSFQNRYTTDSTIVEIKDSIYKRFDEVRVKHDQKRYTDDGYFCNCPR